MSDLLESPDLIPDEVQQVFDKYAPFGEWKYNSLHEALKEVGKLGYTFDYGLDAQPFNLIKIR